MSQKNKIVVVYKSKTGFTKKYAQWIAEALNCDILENEKLSIDNLIQYDTIIYGGGLYVVGINGINLIKNNFDSLKDKTLVVFATGVTPPREEDLQKVWQLNFTEEQRAKMHLFYLRGGFDYSKLSNGNKLLMSMMKMKLKIEKNTSEDAVGILGAFEQSVDYTDKSNIEPIIRFMEGKL